MTRAPSGAGFGLEAAAYRADGFVVTTPLDMIDTRGGGRGTVAYGRANAETQLDADALVLLDGWQDDPHALASFDSAEVLGLAIVV